ncbi:hypothetical protein [Baekduia sp.]|jgi:hypothetical protein|uniref:hypothetical protein n=1 Tax=Baekduia sp. TaxID=2600305 RepID=UPI002DFAA8FC|nr:hypothetical protein [Baekduia sp.]
MIDDERSAEARAVAELALIRLLAGSAPTSRLLIVLGGLIPPTLTSAASTAPAHLGTTDVDVLLVTHLTADRDLSPIERALKMMDFAPDADGWRWSGVVEGRVVKIEFLCDLDDQPAEAIVTPKGCSTLRAVNLRGTGNVEHDHREMTLHGPDGDVQVRYAGLAGYLLSKAAAARTRGADKDYYDLAYVLLHNDAGGPAAAAALINASTLKAAVPGMATTFAELRERFRDDRAQGPRAYAQESLKVTPEEDAALLAADAAAAVREFLEALHR